ncbi:MAG TPA: septation protein A [Gammaproteobacteria bacterium]|nr:septation protein A [Gammaproteobacteria bacterium]
MKFLFDFFPLLLFFAAFKFFGIFVATAVVIAASVVQVTWFRLRNGRFEKMHLITMGLVTVLGGLTIALHAKSFVMWKPTIVNWVFAVIFLGSHFIGKQPLIRRLLSAQIELPDRVWSRLSLMWVAFFFTAGAANIYFVRDYVAAETALRAAAPDVEESKFENLDCATDFNGDAQVLCATAKHKEDVWANFKVPGTIGLTLVFILLQGLYLARHLKLKTDDGPTADAPVHKEKF